jgi:hypothetical protein
MVVKAVRAGKVVTAVMSAIAATAATLDVRLASAVSEPNAEKRACLTRAMALAASAASVVAVVVVLAAITATAEWPVQL